MAVMTVSLAACVAAGGDSGEGTTVQSPPDAPPSAGMMAAAIEQLITEDNTFGDRPPPFSEYLIQSHIDPAAGDGATTPEPIRPLSDAERAAIEAVVEPFGPVRWIDDPADWRTDDLMPTVDGAVIIGVGEPTATGEVGVSLWCGGLCGTWLTYQLEFVDGVWQVTGTVGPVAIS